MCEMGYSVFTATIWLKFAIKTRASFQIIPSIEITNGGFFLLLVEMLTGLVLVLFSPPPIQEPFHWLLLVGVTFRVPKSDGNDGLSLNFIWALYKDVRSSLQFNPPLTYILLWYAVDLVDEWFSVYAIWEEVLSCEVENLITYLFMAYNNYTSVSTAKYVT